MALAPVDLPRVSDVHLDGWVFAFTFFVSLLTGVLFGLAPALDASRTGINEALKEGAGRSSAAPGRARLRQLLVVGEFAISVILAHRRRTDDRHIFKTHSHRSRFQSSAHSFRAILADRLELQFRRQIENFDRAIVQRLEAIPGVDAAAVIAAGLPLERGGNEGVRIANSPDRYSADYREITPGFFRAMGIPLRQGREFSESDSETTNKVVIVNQAFVRKHFPGRESNRRSHFSRQNFLRDHRRSRRREVLPRSTRASCDFHSCGSGLLRHLGAF